MYDQLVRKVNDIETSELNKLINYNTRTKEIQRKIPDHDKYINID